jgi:hypothetical protein
MGNRENSRFSVVSAIVLRMAVISGCDASPVLKLAEHTFDEISAFVGPQSKR